MKQFSVSFLHFKKPTFTRSVKWYRTNLEAVADFIRDRAENRLSSTLSPIDNLADLFSDIVCVERRHKNAVNSIIRTNPVK